MVSIQKPDFTSWWYSILFHSRCDAVAYNSAAFLNLFQGKKRPKNSWKFSCLYLEHCIEGTKSPRNLQFNTQIYRTDLQFPFWNCRKTEFNGLFYDIFRPLKYHMVSYCPSPHFANFGIYFRTKKHAKINLFRRNMVQVIEKPL